MFTHAHTQTHAAHTLHAQTNFHCMQTHRYTHSHTHTHTHTHTHIHTITQSHTHTHTHTHTCTQTHMHAQMRRTQRASELRIRFQGSLSSHDTNVLRSAVRAAQQHHRWMVGVCLPTTAACCVCVCVYVCVCITKRSLCLRPAARAA